MSFEALPERLAQVRAELARRAVQPVTIVAVTKGFGTDAIRAAAAAGIADIGENRVQEAVQKQDALRELSDIRWHLIGHLQRNKARVAAGRFDLVHSLDSLELACELDRRSTTPQRVLLQVNVARESQKSGCAPEEAVALAQEGATVIRLGTVLFGPRAETP